MAVIVIYQRRLDEVAAWPFLHRHMVNIGPVVVNDVDRFRITKVLAYDNSPTPYTTNCELPAGLTYIHDAANGGTAAAYQRACVLAGEAGIDWLLLLDQDTLLPDKFLHAAHTALAGSEVPIGALIPWVFHGSCHVSPGRVTDTGSIVPLSRSGPPPTQITAISSGVLLHVPTLTSLLPLPAGLWLDYVDHWIFLKLHEHRIPVAVVESSLQHDLSIYSPWSLSAGRLTSILNGEATFYAQLGVKARLFYPLRFAVRVMRYTLTRPDLAWHMLGWFSRRMKNGA